MSSPTQNPINVISLSDIPLLDIGNEIQLYGSIYTGKGKVYLVPLPDEEASDLETLETRVLVMDQADTQKFLEQSDNVDIQGVGKAILRKSTRRIDSMISWHVYARDGYVCRYCGRRGPLTVDHVILWEDGGATVEDNLISSCRRCNKLRGNKGYEDWLASADYAAVSKNLGPSERIANHLVVQMLPKLRALPKNNQKSR